MLPGPFTNVYIYISNKGENQEKNARCLIKQKMAAIFLVGPENVNKSCPSVARPNRTQDILLSLCRVCSSTSSYELSLFVDFFLSVFR